MARNPNELSRSQKLLPAGLPCRRSARHYAALRGGKHPAGGGAAVPWCRHCGPGWRILCCGGTREGDNRRVRPAGAAALKGTGRCVPAWRPTAYPPSGGDCSTATNCACFPAAVSLPASPSAALVHMIYSKLRDCSACFVMKQEGTSRYNRAPTLQECGNALRHASTPNSVFSAACAAEAWLLPKGPGSRL